MRAVIYARVSSQVQRDRHTIDSQLRVLPEYVTRQGWTLVRPANHYVDDGRSAAAGKLDKREAFARLLADAAGGAFDVLVVVGVDRLTRSEDIIERSQVVGAFQRAGVRIATIGGELFDLSSSVGDLMALISAWGAAAENKRRREATIRGKVEALRKGRKANGPTPWGYLYDRATGTWSINPELAPVIAELYSRIAAGATTGEAVRWLEEQGVERPRGGRWIRERVWAVVANSIYRGLYCGDREKGLTAPVPPIVSEELWHAARAALAGRRINLRPRGSKYSMLVGIALCGFCGARLCATSASKRMANGTTWRCRYYACGRRLRAQWEDERCALPFRRAEDLDELVWGALRGVLEQPELLEDAMRHRRERSDGVDWEAELADYERRLERLERAEAVILDRFRRGRVSPGAMDAELAAAGRERVLLERNRDVARAQVAAATRTRAELASLHAAAAELRLGLDAATPEERGALVRQLVPGRDGLWVTVGPEQVEIIGHFDAGPARDSLSKWDAAGSEPEPSAETAPALTFRLVAR